MRFEGDFPGIRKITIASSGAGYPDLDAIEFAGRYRVLEEIIVGDAVGDDSLVDLDLAGGVFGASPLLKIPDADRDNFLTSLPPTALSIVYT